MSMTNYAKPNYEKFVVIQRGSLLRRLLFANRRDILVRQQAQEVFPLELINNRSWMACSS